MKYIYPWQKNDWAHLQELRKHPAQGLLLKGTKGIGKLELAINYAQSLLCQHPVEAGFACGKCSSCHWFEQGAHPDYRLLQPEALDIDGEASDSGKKPSKQISIEQIRGLADFFERVRAGYYKRIQENPQRYVVIDAGQTLDVVKHKLEEIILTI